MKNNPAVTSNGEWSKLLSPREHEIALLVAQGLSNKEVARQLGLSDGTVKITLHGIFKKLSTNSRYTLILKAGSATASDVA
jgi:DNA-binding NarL/FixJ family response regulator